MTVPAVVLSVVFGALGFVSGLTFSNAYPKPVETPTPRQFVLLVTPNGVAVGEAKPGLDVQHVLDAMAGKQSESPPKEKFFVPDRSGNNTF